MPNPPPYWFSRDTFNWMIHAGWVVDGRAGGLVLGRTHAEGDIIMVQSAHDGTDRAFIAGTMEDGEYLLNPRSSVSELARLKEINELRADIPSDLVISTIGEECRVLNTHCAPLDKLLWIEAGQFIVNAFATSKHLKELESLNDIGNGETTCDPSPFLRNL
jgi:hypothetical protein